MPKKIGRKIAATLIILALFFPIACVADAEGSPEKTARVSISSPERPIDSNAAYAALQGNLESIGADKLASEHGITGVGQVIGIVDTGVDALMPGMFRQDGTSKIKIWQDLTQEGIANILGTYQAEQGIVTVQGLRLNVRNLRSLSNNYIVGVMPSAISDLLPIKKDIYFVAYDPFTKGVFEGVCIDTNLDMDMSNETILYRYDRFRNVAKIQIDSSKAVSVVVSSIDTTSGRPSFGFDLHGHGTALASLISGYDKGYGGVAPGADIIVVKAIGSTGAGDWYDIIRGVQYCINKGAGVVLIGAVPDTPITDSSWTSLQELAKSSNVHLVIPAGNVGPGAGSLTFADTSGSLIVSSGYYPVATYRAVFGERILQDTWYPFSSCGPDLNGGRGIDISAPAIAPVPEPGYYLSPRFTLMEGTSVSSAYAAGSVALLRQAAIRFGGQVFSGATVSLLQGASLLKGALPVEQGYGKIDLARSWSLIMGGISDPKLKIARKWDGEIANGDLWIEGSALGAFPMWLDNFAPSYRSVRVFATEDWLRCQTATLNLAPIAQRDTLVYGSDQLPPGFYSGQVLVDDVSTLGVDGQMVVSMSLPEKIESGSGGSFNLAIGAQDSRVRKFIRVPQSAQSMLLSLSGQGAGARYALYNPYGLMVEQGFLEESQSVYVGLPAPGLWQVCFFRDPQDGISGTFSIDVDVTFPGVCISDQGVTGDIQEFSVKSDESLGVSFQLIGGGATSERRERQSTLVYAGQSYVIPIPSVDESVTTLSARCGTTRENVLRMCLYRIDAETGKWVEIQRIMTGASGTAEITFLDPPPGEYSLTIEAYTQKASAYAEVDCVLINGASDSTKSPLTRNVEWLSSGINSIQVKPGQGYDFARTIAITKKDDGSIIGVFDRAYVDSAQLPVIQLIGTGQLKTIKAYDSQWFVPVDIPVTIGNATYQLHRGKITAPFENPSSAVFCLPEGAGVFNFEL